MQKNMKEKLSFVIPCYYSEKTIGDVLKRIIATVNEDGRYDYEIICVNDGSTDGTYAVLREDVYKRQILHQLAKSVENFMERIAIPVSYTHLGWSIRCIVPVWARQSWQNFRSRK